MLILERPWTRQPQGAAGVDWGNSITSGLQLLAPLNPGRGFVDLVSGRSLTKTGALTAAPSSLGLYPTFANGSYVDFDAALRGVTNTTPTTIAWTQEPRSTSAYSALLNWRVSGSANTFLVYQAAADANYYFNLGLQTGSASDISTFGGALGAVTNNRADRFCLILPSGTNSPNIAGVALYRNGLLIARAGGASGNQFGASTATGARIGALLNGTDPFEGLIGNFHIWGRALAGNEAEAWTRNPFVTQIPLRIPIPTAAAAAGAPTITALSARSITATSAQPRISYS